MKRRIAKKGDYICRRRKNSDKSFSIRESYRLAYFEIMGKTSYIVRKRKTNNVLLVERTKKEAMRLADFYNK